MASTLGPQLRDLPAQRTDSEQTVDSPFASGLNTPADVGNQTNPFDYAHRKVFGEDGEEPADQKMPALDTVHGRALGGKQSGSDTPRARVPSLNEAALRALAMERVRRAARPPRRMLMYAPRSSPTRRAAASAATRPCSRPARRATASTACQTHPYLLPSRAPPPLFPPKLKESRLRSRSACPTTPSRSPLARQPLLSTSPLPTWPPSPRRGPSMRLMT